MTDTLRRPTARDITRANAKAAYLAAARWFLNEWATPGGCVRYHNGRLLAFKDGWWKPLTKADICHTLATEYKEPHGFSWIHSDWMAIARIVLDIAAPFSVAPPPWIK